MSKSRSNFNKIFATATGATVLAAAFALCFMSYILNYDTPKNRNEELFQQREFVRYMENAQDAAKASAIEKAQNLPDYKKLNERILLLEEAGYNASNSKTYAALEQKADSLINDQISQDPKLKAITKKINESYNQIKRLEADSANLDSVQNLPINQRLKTNWLKINLALNKAQKKNYENRIKSLEKQLQNSK